MNVINTEHWTPDQRELWARLDAFDLDDPNDSLDFSRRLARENGWTHDFSKCVVQQYKRFLFLAMSAGHPVTPSDEVDQAWHLHLVYTRSYWDELCADVLRAPLHHGPTRGGAREGAKFGQWYAQTRASYARFFGEEVPPDIWPDAQIRFGEAPHFRRVNARRSWIIAKPQLRVPTRVAPMLLVVAMLIGAGGAAWGAQLGWNVWNWNGAEFLTLFWMLTLFGFAGVIWANVSWRAPLDEQLPAIPVDAYALARLSDDKTLPIDAALANMAQQKRIEIERGGIVRQTGEPPVGQWERRVWDGIGAGSRQLSLLRGSLQPSLGAFDDGLTKLGLLVRSETRAQISLISAMVPTVLLLLGGSKIMVGLSRGRPVGFLVVSCVLVLVGMIVALTNLPRRSRRGDALLRHMRKQHRRGSLSLPHLQNSGAPNNAPADDALVMGMALWGSGEMDAFGLGAERRLMHPPQTGVLYDGGGGGGGGSDSGGSDGGSGCGGGGCGGCGGCGG